MESNFDVQVIYNKLIGDCFINLNRLFRDAFHAVLFINFLFYKLILLII